MENKELQPFAQGELATPVQTTVNQYGEKSVHIDQVGQMSQNVMILPCFQRTASGAMRQTPQTISTEYYHLFVVGGETFTEDHFIISADRALGTYWTTDDLREKFGRLSADDIEILKTFPALLMPEADGYYAKPADAQQAYLSVIEDIRVQDNGIKIRWRMLWPISMQSLCTIGFELGMKDMTKALSELNRTHWALKRINLIEELKDAGLTMFGI